MQPVAALAAENPDGQIHGHVVRMRARDAEMADAHFGLHRVGFVDDNHAAGRIGRIDERLLRQIPLLPVAEHFLRRRERLVGRDVADDGENRVVGQETARVEGRQIVARDRRERLGRAVVRHAVRMEAVHQPVEHGVGDPLGIFGADLQTRQRLLALPFDLVLRERRVPRHVGQHAHAVFEAVLHHHHVDEREIGARAGAHRTADEINGVVHLLRGLRGRALVEERRQQVHEAEPALGIGRRAGAHEEAHGDDRLLVMKNRDDLQPVRQRLDFVGRELDVARGQRTRGALSGPLTNLRRDTRSSQDEPQRTQCARRKNSHRDHCAPAFPDGRIVSTIRFSGRK